MAGWRCRDCDDLPSPPQKIRGRRHGARTSRQRPRTLRTAVSVGHIVPPIHPDAPDSDGPFWLSLGRSKATDFRRDAPRREGIRHHATAWLRHRVATSSLAPEWRRSAVPFPGACLFPPLRKVSLNCAALTPYHRNSKAGSAPFCHIHADSKTVVNHPNPSPADHPTGPG